ncbi:hypothetical protein KFK09_004165 [Dendrobium nobile]|uniref:Uncharacterized protein n=1 Tax=Dendrobium nobile TaxID=94219 RepID=A0A8T3BZT4_DENNO|nr:hypothetical protein KFK09_004165 [Dendrobium nobile]
MILWEKFITCNGMLVLALVLDFLLFGMVNLIALLPGTLFNIACMLYYCYWVSSGFLNQEFLKIFISAYIPYHYFDVEMILWEEFITCNGMLVMALVNNWATGETLAYGAIFFVWQILHNCNHLSEVYAECQTFLLPKKDPLARSSYERSELEDPSKDPVTDFYINA